MKILFVGYHNPHFISFCEYIERAIDALGHARESFDYRSWLIPGRLRDRIPFLNNWDLKRINRALVSRAIAFKPDVVLVTGGWTIGGDTIVKIKQKTGAVTVNWIADFPLMFDAYLKLAPSYDYFFTSGTDALSLATRAGVKNAHWLPFGCDAQLHKRVEATDAEKEMFDCDICFVGSCYSERMEILEHLADFNVGLWGPGWEKCPQDSPVRKFIRGKALSLEQWRAVYATSKINLNIIGHRCDVMEPYIEEADFRMTNTKVFEALSCGSFQLVDDKADVRTLFEDKKHLCLYANPKELKDAVQHYLNADQERDAIAREGMNEAVSKHTYQHRIQEMLNLIFQ